jgi:hypothetical protein
VYSSVGVRRFFVYAQWDLGRFYYDSLGLRLLFYNSVGLDDSTMTHWDLAILL